MPNSQPKVLAETPDYVAIRKPTGMHSHAQSLDEYGTALGWIAAKYPECAIAADPRKPFEGKLIHRLDQGTSGVLVCARTLNGWQALRKAWEDRESVEKVYLAWVDGTGMPVGETRIPLCHDPKSAKRMTLALPLQSLRSSKSLPARTAFQPVREQDGRTLMIVRIFTGLMHQIRVTLTAAGHPIIGDAVYKKAKARDNEALLASLMPVDDYTKKLFTTISKKIKDADELQERSSSTKESQFALHAYWLRVPGIRGPLGDGVFSPI